MLEHRAAVQQQLVQQDADLSRRAVDGQRRLNLDREKVPDRLWEIAHLSPEMTRGSITGQVKALAMIIAMQNFIPDRRAISSANKSTPASIQPQIYPAACPPGLSRLSRPAVEHAVEHAVGPSPAPAQAPLPYVPLFNSVPDLGVDFPTKKTPLNPFVRPR
jgi:hypothetical protein